MSERRGSKSKPGPNNPPALPINTRIPRPGAGQTPPGSRPPPVPPLPPPLPVQGSAPQPSPVTPAVPTNINNSRRNSGGVNAGSPIGSGTNLRGTGSGSNLQGTGSGSKLRGTGSGSNLQGTGSGSNLRGTGSGSNLQGTGSGSVPGSVRKSSIVQTNGTVTARKWSGGTVIGNQSMNVIPIPSSAGGTCALPGAPKSVKAKPPRLKKSRMKVNYSILMSGTESDSEASSIDSDKVKKFETLSSNEQQVFDAVSSGSTAKVQELLEDSTWTFDFNIRNTVGYTVLHIGIRRQDEEMVKLLLDRGTGSFRPIVFQDALLHAIKEDHFELVTILLALMDSMGIPEKKQVPRVTKPHKSFRTTRAELMDREYVNSEFDSDTTPLLLAARINSYKLVELFRGRGHELARPHVHDLSRNTEDECKECMYLQSIQKANRRLHYYEAICKPAYLCYRVNYEEKFDIILEAFHSIKRLRLLAIEEEEFQKQYLNVATELQEFTCLILQQCRSTEEAKTLLKRPNKKNSTESFEYPRLSYAVDMNLKSFVAHPHTQQIMYQYWAGDGWPEWRTKPTASKLLQIGLRLGFWYIWSLLMFVLSPLSKLGRRVACPLSRCMNSTGSYVLFLAMVITVSVTPKEASGDRGPPRTGVEWPLAAWIFCYTCSMLRQIFRAPRSYFSSRWAWYDLISFVLFYCAFGVWVYTYFYYNADTAAALPRVHWPEYEPALIGEALFAAAAVFACVRVLRLFQLHHSVGPLVTAVGQMAFDVFNLVIFFAVCILAYALGLFRIYQPYHDVSDLDTVTTKNHTQSAAFGKFDKAVETLFWCTFSLGSSDAADLIPRQILRHPNQAPPNRNDTVEAHHDLTEGVGKFMYTTYHVVVSLILLNMLLGLMANTYEQINEDVTTEWMFARTQIWLSYGMDFINPPPFNIIPLPYCLFAMCTKGGGKQNSQRKELDYFPLLRTLVQRYFREMAEISQTQSVTGQDLETLHEELSELRALIEIDKMDGEEERRRSVDLINLSTTDTEDEKGSPRGSPGAQGMASTDPGSTSGTESVPTRPRRNWGQSITPVVPPRSLGPTNTNGTHVVPRRTSDPTISTSTEPRRNSDPPNLGPVTPRRTSDSTNVSSMPRRNSGSKNVTFEAPDSVARRFERVNQFEELPQYYVSPPKSSENLQKP